MLDVEVDPAEAGFDGDRLGRIERHFSRYVDDGRLPGWLAVLTRHGRIVHVAAYGERDVQAGLPIEHDTLFRLFSMTKPITAVAAMMLYEEGAFELKDPVSAFIPSFADCRVYREGSAIRPVTEAMVEPMLVWHLLTHTSGLTYGFHHFHPVDAMYRAAGYEWASPAGVDLAESCDRWAALPLQFQPGTEWNYSVASDVVGRIVEVISGQTLDRFFAERIFGPLGMSDTSFWVDEPERKRLATLYMPEAGTRRAVPINLGRSAASRPALLSGGGGLISSAADYNRFTQMLRGRGELDGVRLLGDRTVRYMTRNHLPGGVALEDYGRSPFAETTYAGVGFGLGFSAMMDAAANKVLASEGDFGWGGAASTVFWVDPAEDITAVFLTQLVPSSTYSIRSQFKQLVYQALVDRL
jgi:CubicO group peptidase (beta-lactamase class C family)